MRAINGFVNNIEDDRLVVTIIIDNFSDIQNYSEGDKIRVVFEYELINHSNESEIILEEKELIGEIITVYDETPYIEVKFETEVPKQLAEYNNVEVIKEGSQIE